jgi:hypothetical protein
MREVMFETMKESSMEEAVMEFEFNDQFSLPRGQHYQSKARSSNNSKVGN